MNDRFTYPAILTPEDSGGFVVSFLDIPEALTSGYCLEDAFAMAEDCLEEAIAGRIDDSEDIPRPSPITADVYAVTLPAQMALKKLKFTPP
jgi:antitoxin HicB